MRAELSDYLVGYDFFLEFQNTLTEYLPTLFYGVFPSMLLWGKLLLLFLVVVGIMYLAATVAVGS